MRMTACLAALTAVLATASAHAQNPTAAPNEAAAALAGPFELSNADHDQICNLTLKADTGPGGMKLEFNRADCAAKFPLLKDVTAWSLVGDNTVKLTDSRGRVFYEFSEVENGMYESLKAGQPLTFLQSAAAAANVVRTIEQMTGDWGVVRGSGDPVCTFTLLNKPTAIAGDLEVKVQPGCDPGIARFAAIAWQMDRAELVVKNARGQIWRFGENDGIWQRIPEGPDAIMLVKK
jgi:hypothetical protein